ncbi:MAG: hypothetical protein NTZ95_06650 [Candidatus Omnitrophica bacterium]|nr:hypothetical protein [Candidatus Omnitrophota bacterium]
MIEINLLPQEMKKKEPRFKFIDLSDVDFKNLPLKSIAIISAGVLIVLHLLLFATGAYSKSKANTFTRKYDSLVSQNKEALGLKEQVDLIHKKVAAIDELMVKRFGWARKLNDLSDSITPGIWLSSLEYDEKQGERSIQPLSKPTNGKDNGSAPKQSTEKVTSKYLIISGYASSMGEQGTALIGKFIQSLKDNPGFYADFYEIELASIKAERIQDQEVMSFKLTCMFR